MNIVHVICAILIPPLAVFLKEGMGKNVWIGLILWILGWIPGVIFAFWRISK